MSLAAQTSNWEGVIRFRKPFSENYTLNIQTNIQAGSFPIHTKARIRWALRVTQIDDLRGQADLELITIENQLLETNNPNLKDIAALNQAFARMYSEIQIRLDNRGKVLEVLNLPVILGKWQETKAEMAKIEAEVPAIAEVIKLNDDIFASPEKVKLAIEHNEFFGIYFHLIYGEKLPVDGLKRTHRNLLSSIDVNWQFSAKALSSSDNGMLLTKVQFLGEPTDDLGAEWIKQAYSNFEINDPSQINPQLREKGQYVFEKESGKLLQAVLTKEENSHPEYIHGKMVYELISDAQVKSIENIKERNKSSEPQTVEESRKYFEELEERSKF